MPEKVKNYKTITEIEDILVHPAYQVWSTFVKKSNKPATIVILKEESKSKVYRLNSVGPEGRSVVAKCRQSESAASEQFIYENILPRFPFPTLQLYGMLTEEHNTWFFMEDAGEERLSDTNPNHRYLRIDWLAQMHSAATNIHEVNKMPSVTETVYLDYLRTSRQYIQSALANEQLDEKSCVVLHASLYQLDFIEAKWDLIVQLASTLPHTLVHGDFTNKNIRIRHSGSEIYLIPFDWELSGRGMPGVDLAYYFLNSTGIEAVRYHSIIRQVWQECTLNDVEAAIISGFVFRQTAAIYWASCGLKYSSIQHNLNDLDSYTARLASAIQKLKAFGLG